MRHGELYESRGAVGWRDIGHAAQAVFLAVVAVLLVSWFGHARREYLQGMRRHEVTAEVAVEPRGLWGNIETCEVRR